MKKTLFLVILALLVLGVIPFAAQAQARIAGVTVNLLTFTGPQVAEPLQRRAPDFEALTGAKINIVTVPNSDLYQTMLTDQATGTDSYQAFVFAPQWIADFATPGYLEDLTDYVNNDPAIQWDDIGQFFRNFSAIYNGSIYTDPARWRLPHGLLPHRRAAAAEHGSAEDVGRLRCDCPSRQRHGHERRRRGRFRLVHFDGEGTAGVLVDHLDCHAVHSVAGNRAGRVL